LATVSAQAPSVTAGDSAGDGMDVEEAGLPAAVLGKLQTTIQQLSSERSQKKPKPADLASPSDFNNMSEVLFHEYNPTLK